MRRFFRHKEHDEQENLSAIDFGPEEDEYEDDGQYIRGITTSNIS